MKPTLSTEISRSSSLQAATFDSENPLLTHGTPAVARLDPLRSLEELSLLPAAKVRKILGNVSQMWLWRRQRDGTLPAPIVISGRRYWTAGQIRSLIEKRLLATQEAR
jgi:hypothetical protein